jgi:cobalt-zinc-cadmium efflux system protein
MSHDHGHPAEGRPDRETSRLKWTLGLVVAYMAAEVVGGLVADSLALLADAGHMLSDAGSLSLALFAKWIAQRPPTPEKTYGYYRTEILAALANGVALVLISLYIFYEAYHRFQDPPEVMGPLMMGVAMGGLLVNVAGLLLLHSARGESLNVQGAWLHVMADAAGSVGAIAAGVLIWWRGWNLADPIASVLIGMLVLASSWKLLRESVAVLMQATPGRIDVDEVRKAMVGVDGVEAVHHLHVWTITSGMESLSAHVVVNKARPGREVLAEVRAAIHERFGIDHCTIQLEPEAFEEPETRV